MKNKILERMYKIAENSEKFNKEVIKQYENEIYEIRERIIKIRKDLFEINVLNEELINKEPDESAKRALKEELAIPYVYLSRSIENLAQQVDRLKDDTISAYKKLN